MIQMKPDKEAFIRVCGMLENSLHVLSIKDVVEIFGWPAVELFLIIGAPSPEYSKQITQLLRDIHYDIKANTANKRSR